MSEKNSWKFKGPVVIALLCWAGASALALPAVEVPEGFVVEELAVLERPPTALALAPAASSFPLGLYVATQVAGYGVGAPGTDPPYPPEETEIIYRVLLNDGSVVSFTALFPESDPVALEFFESYLYISSNNRDGGRQLPGYAGDYGGTIQRVNSAGEPLYGEDFTQVGLDANNEGLGDPVGIAFGPGGDYGTFLYVANSCDVSADIFRVDSDGILYEFLDDGKATGGAACLSTTGYGPIDVAFGFGGLYFTDTNPACNCVRSVAAAGGTTADPPLASFPGPPHDLTFAPAGPFGGSLYVTVGGTIYRVESDGTTAVFATGFGRIFRDSLEFSPDGSVLYVADYDAQKVFTIKPVTYACSGFEPPADTPLIVRNQNRALPLKAQLTDRFGATVTDLDLNPPPIAYCAPIGTGSSEAAEPTETLPAGAGSEGSEFWYDPEDQRWHFNLKVSSLSASSKWTCYLTAGTEAGYRIEPECSVEIELVDKKK